MVEIWSHTIVRNGEPFIGHVLRHVLPLVDKSLVTISEKSDDGTLASLFDLQAEFGNKIEIDTEDVSKPAELTTVRQKQLDKTPNGTWVFFLDDDDWWPEDQLVQMIELINKNEDVDGYSVSPYQFMNKKYHDDSWGARSFTKFFRNDKGVHYRGDWPKDLICKNDDVLYWRKNKRVPHVGRKFIHLSYAKRYSFRNEKWAEEYKHHYGLGEKYPESVLPEVEKIWNILNK